MIRSTVPVTDATIEPVSIDEALDRAVRVDDPERRSEIAELIREARVEIENFTGRALISQTFRLIQSAWPDPCFPAGPFAGRVIELERSPLISVQSVKYYPASGAAQATLVEGTHYRVRTGPTPGFIELIDGQSWPDLANRSDAVEVNFTAGHGETPEAVPADLKRVIRMIVAEGFEYKSRTTPGTHTVLETARRIMESYRVGGWVS